MQLKNEIPCKYNIPASQMHPVSHQLATPSVEICIFKPHCNYFKWKLERKLWVSDETQTLSGLNCYLLYR